jgi:lysophospholipase L1-like esterase
MQSTGFSGRRTMVRALLALMSGFVALMLAEGLLAFLRYDTDLPPVVIAGREARGKNRGGGLLSDPFLRWRFRPGADVWSIRINSMGYRDREVNPVKEPGVSRIVCLGDSCTAAGEPPYPWLLNDLLQKKPLWNRRWQAVNMGVFGYSSSQGLRDFRRKAKILKPDLVTAYYGWNDHWWSGLNKPDSLVMATEVGPGLSILVRALSYRRVGRLAMSAFRVLPSSATKRDGDCRRVPADEFERNLRALLDEASAVGAAVIFITAPRSETLNEHLVTRGNVKSIEDGIRDHDTYAGIVRKVAGDTGTVLLDLAASYSGKTWFFREDGIHPSQEGSRQIAEDLHRLLATLNVPPAGTDPSHRGSPPGPEPFRQADGAVRPAQ